MTIDTMVELSKLKNIIGVKDATNDLFRPVLTRKNLHKIFVIYQERMEQL